MSEVEPRNGYFNEKIQDRPRLPLPTPTTSQKQEQQIPAAIEPESPGISNSQEQENMMDSIYDEPEAQLRSGKDLVIST